MKAALLAAAEGRAIAVVASQRFSAPSCCGLSLAAPAEGAGPPCRPRSDGPAWLRSGPSAATRPLWTLAPLSNTHSETTNNAMEILFSMLCRNIDCRYENVNCKYVTSPVRVHKMGLFTAQSGGQRKC